MNKDDTKAWSEDWERKDSTAWNPGPITPPFSSPTEVKLDALIKEVKELKEEIRRLQQPYYITYPLPLVPEYPKWTITCNDDIEMY
jgi:hypothetical protein